MKTSKRGVLKSLLGGSHAAPDGALGRGRWMSSPREQPDHEGQTLVTRDHDVIRTWAAERGAAPATVSGTEHGGRPGVLRFDFPYGNEDELERVGWDHWFDIFDQCGLVMLFRDTQEGGMRSDFCGFAVCSARIEGTPDGAPRGSSSTDP